MEDKDKYRLQEKLILAQRKEKLKREYYLIE